jgi:hypothetical protein
MSIYTKLLKIKILFWAVCCLSIFSIPASAQNYWMLTYTNGNFFLKPISGNWKLDSTIAVKVDTLTGHIAYWKNGYTIGYGPNSRGTSGDSIALKKDAFGVQFTQDRPVFFRGTSSDSLGAGTALGSAAYSDSVYLAAQRLLRILYSDTTSSVAMRWQIQTKIGVAGYSTGDTSAFSTSATRLAIYVPGARGNQIWYANERISGQTGLPAAGEWITATAIWDSVIVKRNAGTTSGLKIDYFRIK